MICISVTAKTNDEALERMDASFLLADLVELRIDSIEGADLTKLLSAKKGPVIVTARRREEGGFFAGTERERIALLCEAARRGADLIDVELSTDETLAAAVTREIRKGGGRTKLIISCHDFRKTSSYRTLQGRYNRCISRGADIVKVVTFARSLQDNLTILRLVDWAQGTGRSIIAHCMGEKGRVSRVMAPLFGSYLAFAALTEGQESAPGQLTAPDMKRILGALER
jgi:3-dehydroquinate dehydratase type I